MLFRCKFLFHECASYVVWFSRNRFHVTTQTFKILLTSNAFHGRFRCASSCDGCVRSCFSINRLVIFTGSAYPAWRCGRLRLFKLRLRFLFHECVERIVLVSRNRFRIATQAFKILFGSNAFPRRFRSACSCAGCTTSWFSINRRIIFTDSACLATRCWGLRLFRLRLRSGCARSSFSIYRTIPFTDSISLGARCFLTSWSCWRLFIASFERLICFWKFRKVRPGNWSCRQFSSFWRKAFCSLNSTKCIKSRGCKTTNNSLYDLVVGLCV